MSTNVKNLVDYPPFDRLTVVSRAGSDKHNKALWNCQCICGNTTKVVTGDLIAGKSRSCGCLNAEIIATCNLKPPFIKEYNGFTQVHNSYAKGAKKDNRVFELTREQTFELFTSNCVYCGTPPCRTRKYLKSSFVYNGIDRLDNSVGYLESNCVACCTACNTAKSNMTVKEFAAKVKAWYETLVRVGLIK